MIDDFRQAALDYHHHPQPGKLGIRTTKRMEKQRSGACMPAWGGRTIAPEPGADRRHIAVGPAGRPRIGPLIAKRGKLRMSVSDNGSEFTSNAILGWTDQARVEWHYIAPGKPM